MTFDTSLYPIGIATASLGMAANHTLEAKFRALQRAGFTTCELGFGAYMDWVRSEVPDLPASTCPPEWSEGGEPDPSDTQIWDTMFEKAEDMKALARSFGLSIVVLQPLNQFEGWPEGSERGEWARRKAEKWIPLCSKLGVELVQVGSNDKPDANAPQEKWAADLRWLAEMAAGQSPPVKIAYESWCFAKNVNDWEQTWEIVRLGDHPNLGICLDTAQFPLCPAYGWDPTTGQGWSDEQYHAMLDRIRKVPGDKIFYVELSDVLKPVTPLWQGSPFDAWGKAANSPRGDSFVWAICGRPVPLIGKDAGRSVKTEDDMGGARVISSLKAILETGFKGHLMFEMFEAISMENEDPEVPLIYAQACALARKRLIEALSS